MSRWTILPCFLMIAAAACPRASTGPAAMSSVTASDVVTSMPPASAAEWPGWLGPARDGKSPDKGLLKQWPEGGPRLLWKATGIGQGYSSATIAGGLVYITGIVDGNLVVRAFDMSGKPVWQVQHGQGYLDNQPGSRSSAVIDGSNLYIVGDLGLVGCYDAKTGAKKWTHTMQEYGGRPADWGYAESVLIYGNLAIITPGGSHCVVALNKATGDTVWQSTGFTARAQYGSCIAAKLNGIPMIIVGTQDGIYGINPKDGTMLWQNGFASGNVANCNTPAYSDGYVFWANGYGKGGICLQLSASGGKVTAREAYHTPDMECHHGGYVIVDGCVYGNNGMGWSCLDLKTGEKKWQARGVGKGSLCWADGMLYLYGENGGRLGLAACTPTGFEMKGQFAVEGKGPSWSHPVVIGGRLYVRYDDNLYCFDVKGA